MRDSPERDPADVCLILEGTYPFVAGGVSTWTHDLLQAHSELRFHILALVPPHADLTPRYEMPSNVVGSTVVALQRLTPGRRRLRNGAALVQGMEAPLTRLFDGGGLEAFSQLLRLVNPYQGRLGSELLLNSRAAWALLLRMYERRFARSSFLDYFWSWRALLGGLYTALLGPLPPARVYHTISTGYAGLYAARAHLTTGRPALLTEHGIYTNERRIEIAMADWLFEMPLTGLGIDKKVVDLKDFWVDAFSSYARVCYEACTRIITLYEGNQRLQLDDGAPRERLAIIPNGIDYPRFSAIRKEPGPHPPRIALVGRVVPIKDIKTFIRAVAQLRTVLPDAEAWIMGPTDEDEGYFRECQQLVAHLGLEDGIQFTGQVTPDDYYGAVDVIALTSISEAQPLVILEAGAAGIPAVATDVGSCRELILGRGDESPHLGPAGAVVPLADPEAAARAMERLLTDPKWYVRCSQTIRQRVKRYYDEADINASYAQLYAEHLAAPDAPAGNLAEAC